MRLSADPDHPHYCAASLPALVFLDGEEVQHCLRANEEAGTVVCAVVNERGFVMVDGSAVQEVTLRGRVSIVYRDMDFDTWMSERTEAAHYAFMLATGPKLPPLVLDLKGMV